MKRMSDVFELPMSHQSEECGTIGSVYDANADIVLLAQSKPSDGLLRNSEMNEKRNERSIHAARAINSVDALAEALSIMIDSNWQSARIRREAREIAKAALAAYRGEDETN